MLELVRTFFTSTGPGGSVVIAIISTLVVVYSLVLTWIALGGRSSQKRKNTERNTK